MSLVPEDEITQETLTQWYNLSKLLKKTKASEILLRKKIFEGKFPKPVEGAKNKVNIDQYYVLKGTYVLNRNVDVGAYKSIQEKLRELDVSDEVVEWKPSLKKSEYNKLTDDQKLIFDQCLIIKPGSPALEIVLPAAGKKKLEAQAEIDKATENTLKKAGAGEIKPMQFSDKKV